MPKVLQNSLSPSTNLIDPNENRKGSKIKVILDKLDIFSYVPEPHTYPISTLKSEVASIVFIIAIVCYLTYDFYRFITANSPLANSYDTSIPENVQYDAPQIAFGFMYGPSLNSTLNDPSYFSYQLSSLQSQGSNSTSPATEQSVPLNLVADCRPEWLGAYNTVYKNMTCVNSTMKLMNVPSQNPNSLSLELVIRGCQPSNGSHCQNSTSLSQMTAGGRFFLIINLPAGFDYTTGSVDSSDYSVQIYEFFLIPGLFSRISIEFYPFQVTTFPTYLTSWTQSSFFYMQSYQPVVHLSNVSTQDPFVMAAITFQLYPQFTVVEVQYQTLINRVSEWGALASLIMGIFGFCCLAYNKDKFLQRNPSWSNFDQAIKNKQQRVVQIEMQTACRQKDDGSEEQPDAGAIESIRKKVQLSMK